METSGASSIANGRENKRPAEEGQKPGRENLPRQGGMKKPRFFQEGRYKNAVSRGFQGPRDQGPENGDVPSHPHLRAFHQCNGGDEQLDLVYAIVKNVGRGDIRPEMAVEAFREKFAGLPPNSSTSFRLLDCIGCLLDVPSFKPNLEALLEGLESSGLVSNREIVAVIDSHKLDDCGFSNGLTTIAIRERTRKQFVLMSYSLWRESGQGFDLLQQLMYGQSWNANDTQDMARFRDHVKFIAGKYSLCPTRILYELVAWCASIDGSATTFLLQQYPRSSIEQVVCLMLSQCQSLRKSYQLSKKQYWKVPKTLGNHFFRLCASLAASGSLMLDNIYSHLSPPDAHLGGLVTHYMRVAKSQPIKLERGAPPVTCLMTVANCSSGETSLRQAIKIVRKTQPRSFAILDSNSIHNARDVINARHAKLLDQVSYTGGAHISHLIPKAAAAVNPTDATEPNEEPNNEKPDKEEAQNEEHGSTRVSHTSAYAETMDVVMYDFLLTDTYSYVKDHIFALECDKLTLLTQLIELADDLEGPAWKTAERFMRHLHLTVKFPIILHGNVSYALCALVSRVLTKQLAAKNYGPCLVQIMGLLELTGPILYLDPVSFSKLLRLMESCISTSSDLVCKCIWKHILPSMALMLEGSCQPSARLWHIMSKLPASKRYSIYHLYLTKVLEPAPNSDVVWITLVKNSHNGVLNRTRSIFKRVTSSLLKTNKSASVRSNVSAVSGFSSVNPFAVSQTIITQSEMFENLVLPLSEIGKYFGYLTCDVFFFMLCRIQNQVCFSAGSECDEIGMNKRLSVNAQLAARFFRRHSNVDLAPLLLGVITILLRSMMINTLNVQIHNNGNHPLTGGKTNSKETPTRHSFELKPIETRTVWSYPDDISGAWLVLEYICKLMELAGGVPQLAEAHALTADQLDAQAGGVLLRSEIMTQDPEEEMCGTTSRESLGKSILRPLFCRGILLLAGKMRLEILYDSDYRKKVMSLCATIDRLQKVALQLSEFKENVDAILNRNDSSHLNKHMFELPPLHELRRFWEDGMALYLATMSCNGPVDYELDKESKGPFNPEFVSFISGIHLPDIWVPKDQYNKTLQKLSDWIKDGGSSHSSGAHRRLKKLKSRYLALEREMRQQTESVELTTERFAGVLTKDWIRPDAQIGQPITISFLKQCIAPRILVNEAEAAFCGRLVDIMLSHRLQFFNFFDFCNCWTKMLMSLVRCCTEREAPLLAIFVSHVFSIIKHWCNSPKEFEEMAKQHPCYGTTFKFYPEKALTHAQLMTGTRKWELRVLRALSCAIPLSLTEAEAQATKQDSKIPKATWIDQKGAVVFLARCHENFPITAHSGKKLLAGLSRVTESAQTKGWKDVYVAASTLLKTFEKYEREEKWLPDKR